MGVSNFSLLLEGFEMAVVIKTPFHLQDLFPVQEFFGS